MYVKRPVPQTSIRVCPVHFIRISIYVSYIYYVYIYICFIYIFHTYIYIYIYVHNETRSTDVYTGMPAYFKCISPAHFKCCAHDTQRYCTIGCTVCSASAQYAALSSICTAICMQPLIFSGRVRHPLDSKKFFVRMQRSARYAALCSICRAVCMHNAQRYNMQRTTVQRVCMHNMQRCNMQRTTVQRYAQYPALHNQCAAHAERRGGGLGSSTIFKKINEPYAPS